MKRGWESPQLNFQDRAFHFKQQQQQQQRKSSPNLISPQHTLETPSHYIHSKANLFGEGPFPTMAPRAFHRTSSYLVLSFWIHTHTHTHTIQMKRQKVPHSPTVAGTRVRTRNLPFKFPPSPSMLLQLAAKLAKPQSSHKLSHSSE